MIAPGFFYFVLHCPDDYPHSPPKVRLLTTGGGAVRFNPNLYANGKVCLRSVAFGAPSVGPKTGGGRLLGAVDCVRF